MARNRSYLNFPFRTSRNPQDSTFVWAGPLTEQELTFNTVLWDPIPPVSFQAVLLYVLQTAYENFFKETPLPGDRTQKLYRATKPFSLISESKSIFNADHSRIWGAWPPFLIICVTWPVKHLNYLS